MWIGDLVAERFLLEQEVAVGGGGRIFRARDAVDSRQVAVKAILHLDHDAVVRFKRESLLLARISHPGLLRYLAHGVSADGAPWLATEWLEGEDLRRHLSRRGALVAGAAAPGVPPDFFLQRGGPPTIVSRRGREDPPLPPAKTNAGPGVALLPTEAVLTLLRRLAAALATLHAEGIVHRDIKPSNIFLVDGLVSQSKLIDLGLARNLLNPGDVTRTGLVVGTPRYMAPEQARCDAHVTAAADVWAVGCVAYECLSGQSPFDGDDLADMFARILHDEPAALTGRGLDAPELLLGLVHRMLSKDPAERPRDGAALVDEIEIILASERMAGRAVAVRSPDGTYDGIHAAEEEGLVPASGSSLRDLERRVGCSLFAAAGYDADDVARFEAAVAAASLRASSCWSVPPSPGAPAHRASSAWVVRLPVSGTTVDLAHRAVRLALQLVRELPGWSFALTTGFFPVVFGGDADAGDEALAASLVGRAAAGQVIVDARTASLLESRYAFAGTDGGYRLTGPRVSETTRTLLGQPTRTVGRRRELALLESTWAECVEEPRARALLVTAAPGVGKSRLRWELLRTLGRRREPHLFLELRGDSMTAGAPFAMLAPALRRLAGVIGDGPATDERARLTALVQRSIPEPEAARVAVFLGELTGIPYDDRDDEALRAARSDSMLLAEQMSAAFVTWLRAEARRQPILIIVEDLHWGDRPSIAFLDAALRELRGAPLFVLALARPEVHDVFPTLWSGHALDEIRLDPLGRKAAIELIRAVLGDDASIREVEAVFERSGGNALYLEEILRAVAQDGVAAAAALPDTVVGMVQARLGTLGPEPRRILRAASVFGEVFWEGALRFLVGEGGGGFSLSDWLHEFVRRELITPVRDGRFPGDQEYRFRHALVRDSAYAFMTDDDRARAHRLAGQWLERAGERDAHRLASHYDLGGAQADAVRWYAAAAESALEGNDLDSALASVARARACGAHGATLGGLHALAAAARYWQSRYREAADEGVAAVASTDVGSSAWFHACGTTLVAQARLGDFAALDRLFAQLAPAVALTGAKPAQLVALCRGTFQLIFKGRFADADASLARIAELAAAAPSLDALTRAQVSHVRGVRAGIVGDVGTFLDHLEAAVAAFDQAGDVRNVALERTTIGWCYAELGQYDEALRQLRENLARCVTQRTQQGITYARVNLGYALERASLEPAEAAAMLNAAVEETAAVKNQRLEGWSRGHLASLWLRHGDPERAEREARQACELLRNAPALYGWVLALLARACLRQGNVERAETLAAEAMKLVEDVGGLLQGCALPPLVLAEARLAAGARSSGLAIVGAACERLERRALTLREPAWRDTFFAVAENAETLALRRLLA